MIDSENSEIIFDLFASCTFKETEEELVDVFFPVFLEKLNAEQICIWKENRGKLERYSFLLSRSKECIAPAEEISSKAQLFYDSKEETQKIDLCFFFRINGYGVLAIHQNQDAEEINPKPLIPLIQQLSLMLRYIKLYQSQKEAEEKLNRSEKILKAVASATAELLNGTDIESSITKSLYFFGEATGVDRVYFFKADNNEHTLSQTCEWNSGSAEPQINNPYLQNQPLDLFDDSIEILKNNQVYNFIVREIPDGSPTKAILEMQDIKSVLLVPVIVEDLFWGFVGFDDCYNEYIWTDNEVAILQSFATSISKAALQEMYEKKLQDMALFPIQNPDPVYRINNKGEILLQNHAGEKIHSFKYKNLDYNKEDFLALISKTVFEDLNSDLEVEVESNENELYLLRLIISPDKQHLNVYSSNISKRVEVESDLINSENRLRQLILSLDEAVLLEDENRRVIFTNQMFCEFFSIPMPPENLIGYDCAKAADDTKHLFTNEEAFVQEINKLVSKRKLVANQEIDLKNGKVLSRSYIPLILNNEYKGHLWKYQDVTLQKNYERNLEVKEAKYRNIISNMNLGLMEVDLNDRISFVNQSFEKLSGYTHSELIGKKAAEMFLDKKNVDIIKSAGEERLKGISSTYELEAIDKQGNTRWWLVSGAPNYNDNGEIIGSLGVHLDLTENRLAQERIRTNEEIFRKITESSTDIVTLQKPDLSFVYISPSVENVLGYKEDEAKSMTLLDLWNEAQMEIYQDLVSNYLFDDTRQNITIEIQLKSKSGQWVWLESAVSKIYNSRNKLILIQGTTRDISKRKRLEEESEEARKREKELIDLKKVFVSMASHQFRTPLTVIQSNVEIIESVFEAEEAKLPTLFSKSVMRMKAQIQNMTALMNDILILGKLDNNNLKLVLEEVEMNEYIQEIINDSFNSVILNDDRKVEFIPLSKPIKTKLDKQLFSHAFVNIVSNALKYSIDAPSPKVRVAETNGLTVRIEIIDFGIGIPENDLENIRSPFYRGKNVSKIQGTGLGLSIADQFVSLHGGILNIFSKPNHGTRVEILMPIKNE